MAHANTKSAHVLALADDLTGALEVGARLAGSGLHALVTTRQPPSDLQVFDALVIDTETRHLSPAQAAHRIATLTLPAQWIYKKTDSTLRGNIGAELAALSAAYPDRGVIYLPAYPEMGRTVQDGHLYVHGELLHTTAFARDPLNPVTSSRVLDALEHCHSPIQIFDAVSEDDVARVIHTALQTHPHPIFAGPANVAGHLAAALDLPRHHRESWRRLGKTLVVNGSLHPLSAAQMQHARSRAWDGWTFLERFQPGDYDTLIVFGGDTAFEILDIVGITELRPICEVIPGVPVSEAGSLQLITKAGGFGAEDVLSRIREAMS